MIKVEGTVWQKELGVRNYAILDAESKEGYKATLMIRTTEESLVLVEGAHNDAGFFVALVDVALETYGLGKKVVVSSDHSVNLKFHGYGKHVKIYGCTIYQREVVSAVCKSNPYMQDREYKFDFVSPNGVTKWE